MNTPGTRQNRNPLKLKPAAALSAATVQTEPWKILVVDDDEDVHAVTRIALSDIVFQDRRLELLKAKSAAEAFTTLAAHSDIAVCLLDVVMETDTAGLELVQRIRKELNNQAVRIILRTGQPGQAPEARVILDYDINDYKAKTELTSQRLFTSIISALRAHETIMELERHRKQLKRILDQSDALFQLYSLDEFGPQVLEQLAAFLDCPPNGILCTRSGLPGEPASPPDESSLHVFAGAGEYSGCHGCRFSAGCHHSALQGELYKALAAGQDQYLPTRTLLVFPASSGVPDTAIMLEHPGRRLSDRDTELLQAYVRKIRLAMQSALLHDQLNHAEKAATTDFLTGLTNRRQLSCLGQLLLGNAQRSLSPLSLAMLDIDHFKLINDELGHAAGDAALKAIAELLRRRFRQSDLVARYGGEEFCVIIPGLRPKEAISIFEALREQIAAYPFMLGDSPRQITVSIGLAHSSEAPEASLDQLIERADHYMYAAKLAGRNRLHGKPCS